MPDAADRPRFLLYLIKPSHYDDDGYVIQWRRSALPSNSLACLYGIARDAIESGALGPEADPEIIVIDETNTRVQARANRPADRRGRRARARRLRRRAVEPVPAGDGPRPPAARRGRSGRDRRLPRLGMSGHAAGDAGFAQGRARPRDFALRRRGRGAFRRRSPRRRGRFAEADLQLPSTTCRTSTARPPPICRRRRSAGRSA